MHLLLGIIERTQLNCTTWFRLKHPSQRVKFATYMWFFMQSLSTPGTGTGPELPTFEMQGLVQSDFN